MVNILFYIALIFITRNLTSFILQIFIKLARNVLAFSEKLEERKSLIRFVSSQARKDIQEIPS